MALTILDRPNPYGEAGSALGSGLEMLAQNKLQQLAQRNQQAQHAKGLQSIQGISPEMAQSLSLLDPQTMQLVLKDTLARPGEQAYAQSLNQLLGGQPQGSGEEQAFNLPDQSRLNARQATELAKLKFQKDEAESKQREKKQSTINATNKTYNEALDKAYNINQKIADLGQELTDLVKTGKVASGLEGQLKPQWLLNDESRRFDAIGQELATLIAAQSGVPTNFKIKLAQSSKPNLTHATNTQLKLAEHLINQTKKVADRFNIRNELVAENQGEQPANLSSLVENKYKEMSKKNNGLIDSLDEVKDNLMRNKAPVGTEIEDEEGNVLYWNGEELVEKL